MSVWEEIHAARNALPAARSTRAFAPGTAEAYLNHPHYFERRLALDRHNRAEVAWADLILRNLACAVFDKENRRAFLVHAAALIVAAIEFADGKRERDNEQ